jgi:hypothetical protein
MNASKHSGRITKQFRVKGHLYKADYYAAYDAVKYAETNGKSRVRWIYIKGSCRRIDYNG